jgi:lipopolysaccharide transport system ATP-binding protein
MRPAIRIDNLSKSYRLSNRGGSGYRTLRESLSGAAANLWGGLQRAGSRLVGRGRDHWDADSDEFWALKNVSFDVQPGEVVGIIGRNGAGKSTLLKILSRITEPTSGRGQVRGRLCSLLEVGTGFHPELTGRENIFLNGSILGMTRGEITRKFDEIVAFSEVEQFLDTPVKRYSSGMFVRLAFAVAAHLEPEVLLLDEVLAVGDYSFQAKSRARMEQIRDSGRTILFVSHNLQAVTELCRSCVVLDHGRVVFAGPSEESIRHYCRFQSGLRCGPNPPKGLRGIEDRVILGGGSITRLEILNERGRPSNVFRAGERVVCEMEVRFDEDAINPHPACIVTNAQGLKLFDVNTVLKKLATGSFSKGRSYVFAWKLTLGLLQGQYTLSVDLARADLTGYYDRLEPGMSFEMVADGGSRGIVDLRPEFMVTPIR